MGNGIVKLIIESVLNVIYSGDDNCLICKEYCEEEEYLCISCLKKIEYCNSSFSLKKEGYEFDCYSATYYANIIIELVRRLKYRGDFASGEFLGNLFIKLIEKNIFDFDIVTFVPMTAKSKRKRGFNQSQFLASIIGKTYNKPIIQLLQKHKDTKDQIGLNASSRWENLNDCFQFIGKYSIKNKCILLVDDVITTGATSYYCSKQLIDNGAGKVIILTVAKSTI